MTTTHIEIRVATPADRPQVLDLATSTLGWQGDERDREYFAWKHDENPFGRSPAWLALDGDQLVGFRTFLRWSLARGGQTLALVRAVDTATLPGYQGRGIFRRLTLRGVAALEDLGVAAVFNTPNSRSGPGYLTMGWTELGRPALGLVPSTLAAVPRMARSKHAAEKWSERVAVGDPAASVLREQPPGTPSSGRWSTPRSKEYLAWRYSFEPLWYRAAQVRGGVCVFRVRRRGTSRELVVCEWLSSQQDRNALRQLVKDTKADYAIGLGMSWPAHGALNLPRQGPRLMWRPLAEQAVPSVRELALCLGDLELF